jgi:glucan phosphoethanolaminetransferase (alkaline phosphatase superfamily)
VIVVKTIMTTMIMIIIVIMIVVAMIVVIMIVVAMIVVIMIVVAMIVVIMIVVAMIVVIMVMMTMATLRKFESGKQFVPRHLLLWASKKCHSPANEHGPRLKRRQESHLQQHQLTLL